MRSIVFFLVIFCPIFIFSQVEDQFTDGNFTLKPNWIGTDAKFEINSAFQLKTKDSQEDTAFLSVKHELTNLEDKEWRFWIKQSFSPSANNYARVYLTASSYELKTQPDGYFLQFGESGSIDAIRLFKSENKVIKELGNATIGAIATNFIVAVKIVREKDGTWRLFTDYNGGDNYIEEFSVNENSSLLGSYFGFYCKYTKTNASKFYFDNVYIGPKIVDKIPPILNEIIVKNDKQILLTFSEKIDTNFILNTDNYLITNNTVFLIKRDSVKQNTLLLTLNNNLINANTYTLQVLKVQDLSGNSSSNLSQNFHFLIAEKPLPGDVILNEIMANPSPPIGLAELEYIEIYNNSNKYFNLENWLVTDGTSKGKIANGWLAPHTYRLLCNTNSLAFMNQALGVTSFPSLNNSGDKVQLLDSSGLLLDEIQYDATWYHDDVKSKGGWSLERINPNHPCSDGNNWSASTHLDGGTPGEQNAVYDTLKKTFPIDVTMVDVSDSINLKIVFNQHVKSNKNAISVSNDLTIDTLITTPNTWNITFKNPIQASKENKLTISSIENCWGDITTISIPFALSENPMAGDLIINEILFNPYSDGSDFVEITNNSKKWINSNSLAFGNTNQGEISTEKVTSNRYIKPGEVVFFASEKESIVKNYPSTNANQFIQTKLPSYNNDSGTVILLYNNTIIDKVSYQENWHFTLLNDYDGKSLERISTANISQDKSNWQTASQTSGFATPGNENSHAYKTNNQPNEYVFLTSSVLSPNNDGVDDLLELNFNSSLNEINSTVTIYQPNGEIVKHWLKNEFIGKQEKKHWDGIDNKGQRIKTGIYLLVVENLSISSGNQETLKIPFAVTID